MHHLLYIPGAVDNDPDRQFAAAGIAELLAPNDARPVFFESSQTPDTGRGSFYTWRNLSVPGSSPDAGYHPGLQEWWPALPDPDKGLPGGRYWYGFVRGESPRPVDLARPRLLDGPEVQCRDGQHWQWPNGMLLPHDHGLDAEGRFCRKVCERYASIYDQTVWAYRHWEAALHSGTYDQPAANRSAVTLLAANYRVTRDIVARLGLLDDELCQKLLFLVTDAEALMRIQEDLKKRAELAPRLADVPPLAVGTAPDASTDVSRLVFPLPDGTART